MICYYMKNNTPITKITADYRTKSISIENYTNDIIDRAFGIIEKPSWEQYENFLESRCIPRDRADIKIYLRDIGVDFYSPIDIIEKTKGVMAGDHFWIDIKEI